MSDHERARENEARRLPSRIGTGRMEGFSDGVMAVIITVMVLQIVIPDGDRLSDLLPVIPTFLAYALSFTFVGIYWNNHHHLIRATERIGPAVMWANLALLFWLSLIPFATAWLGRHPGTTWPTLVYGVICLLTGGAYSLLVRAIIRTNPSSAVARRMSRDIKGIASECLYAIGSIVALFAPYVSICLFVAVSIMWLIPDRRLSDL